MPPLKPKARADLTLVDFDDEIVAYAQHGDHGHLHYLNPTATLVFRLCDGTATVDETAAELADVYRQPQAQMKNQVRELVRDFRRRDLLTYKPVAPRRSSEEDEDGAEDHDHDHEHHGAGHELATEREVDGRAQARIEVPRNE